MRALVSVAVAAVCLSAAPAVAQYQDPRQPQAVYESPYNPQLASQLPQGSYRNSCNSVQVTGSGNNARLSASCRDIAGRFRASTIAYRQCVGDIGNNNGMLVCAGATATPGAPPAQNQPLPAPARLPTGSWTQSCIRGQIDGNRFIAQCLDEAGRRIYAEASSRTCPSYSYSNVNGRLVCDDDIYDRPGQGRGQNPGRGRGNDPGYGQLPLGPWRSTCRDATMRDGYVLTARCTNNRGALQSTSIDVRACRRPAVVNENGVLKCE